MQCLPPELRARLEQVSPDQRSWILGVANRWPAGWQALRPDEPVDLVLPIVVDAMGGYLILTSERLLVTSADVSAEYSCAPTLQDAAAAYRDGILTLRPRSGHRVTVDLRRADRDQTAQLMGRLSPRR